MPLNRTEDLVTAHHLTDPQRVLLSAASQRDDGLLVQPDRLKGGAARMVVEKIIAVGLANELTVGPGAPHWREDEDGTRFGLKITTTGLRAIADGDHLGGSEPTGQGNLQPLTLKRSDHPAPSGRGRDRSKQALVITLLERLRQRGHEITRIREADQASVYRIVRREAGSVRDAPGK